MPDLMIFVVLAVCGVIAFLVAGLRGAPGVQGFFAGLFTGPFGIVVAFLLPLTVEAEAARQVAIAAAVEKLRSAPPEKPAET